MVSWAHIEQQITEAESLTIEALDDEVLLAASEQLAEMRETLAKFERKLRDGGREAEDDRLYAPHSAIQVTLRTVGGLRYGL